MEQSILFEALDLTEEELQNTSVVREGKVTLLRIPGTSPQVFKAENTTDDVMNFYNFGLEVGAFIMAKTVKKALKKI